jgi:hypothetical protein
MRVLKIIVPLVLFFSLFTSCIVNEYADGYREGSVQVNFVEEYDLWYLDYHATSGADEIPFMQLAFTLSFDNGRMYANNTISGIGLKGGGYGIQVGEYTFNRNLLVSNHELDGVEYFEIKQISENEIEMYHAATNTSYFLIGYDTNEFDYDKLFYENIEYLLQDFEIWNKYYTSSDGARNEFDYENFLSFTAENNTTFYSSKSQVGTDIDLVFWNYEGSYEVQDIIGVDDLKILTLGYDSVNTESFELTVVSDIIVELFHISSETVYRFEGDYFIQSLKEGKTKKKNRIERKRTKIKRQKVNKSSY